MLFAQRALILILVAVLAMPPWAAANPFDKIKRFGKDFRLIIPERKRDTGKQEEKTAEEEIVEGGVTGLRLGALGQHLLGSDEDWLLYVPAILGITFAAITAKARADFETEDEYYDYLIEAAQQEREAKQQTLVDYTERLERRKAELTSLEKRYKRESKIAREAKKQLAELEKEMQVIEAILTDLEGDITHLTQAIEEAEASQAAELEDAQKRIAKLTEERDRLQDTLDAVMEIKGSQEEVHTTATRLSLLGNV